MNSIDHPSDQCNQVETVLRDLIIAGASFAPTEGKRPALKTWRWLQSARPTGAQVEQWVREGAFDGGIGVVSGMGRIVALDFDDVGTLHRFTEFAPVLAGVDTYREQTPRGGAHWFFRVAPDTHFPHVRKIAGGELRGDGSWTVVAPSPGYVRTGGSWLKLHTLSTKELRIVEAFFSSFGAVGAPLDGREGRAAPAAATIPRPGSIDPAELVRYYNATRQTAGRNDSLFAAAIMGRDMGLALPTVEAALIDTFTTDPAPAGHRGQSVDARCAEGRLTLKSAFSRPPRQQRARPSGAALPNQIRERLVQKSEERDPSSGRRLSDIDGGAQLARVLDGLLIAGVRPGSALTERQVMEALGGRIGRNTIRRAFNTLISILNGAFSRHEPTTREEQHNRQGQNNLRLLGGQNGSKVLGRPARAIRMPSFDALAFFLGLPARRYAGDAPEEVGRAKAWRRSLHKALIARRPGQYTVAFLAERLGVCVRTLRRYTRELSALEGLIVRVMTAATPLDERSIRNVLSDDPDILPGGVWLESRGRRYPPLQELALKLLRSGVRLVKQLANWYGIDDQILAQLSDNGHYRE